MFLHRLWNWFYGIRSSFLSNLVVILCWSDVLWAKYRRKHFFAGFETRFTAFANLFLALLWLFCVDRRYCCQNTGENVSLPALKTALRHSPFGFEQFFGNFALIRGTVGKIHTKMFLRRLWNPLYIICCFFLALLLFFASIRGTVAKIRVKTFLSWLLNRFYGIFHF